ncbi:MAG: [Fe-Fe] hydrogenase large subunit C-terminal domain-containing protein, partial [Clostridia bacterium]
YTAIINVKRPCENSCKVKAISLSDSKSAKIDNNKCTACGACVYQCPFGAITDKSYITNVIDMLKRSLNNTKYKVYALIAPSIASQFNYATLGQVISGIKELGFFSVVEAALGADMVADAEARELVEKGFLMSSCCPSFVSYVEKQFPDMASKLSKNLSPMATIAKYIKSTDETAKIIFI